MNRLRGGAVAAASGFVFAASTPPIDAQPGILLGLVGFAIALRVGSPSEVSAMRPARLLRWGAGRGFLFGLAANLLALRFVPEVIARFTPLPTALGWVALLLLSAIQALPWTVGGAAAAWLTRPGARSQRPATPPALAFGCSVYLATFLPAIFPWTPAGGLARWPILLQSAELVGERGTSLVLAIGCGFAAEAILRARELRRALTREVVAPAGLALLVLVVLLAYGALRERAIDRAREVATHAKVALLQPDFDPVFHWEERRASIMLERLTDLTRRAEADGATLTVWPESAYPYTLAHGTTRSPRGARAILQDGVKGPVLTGLYMSKDSHLGTNSAILVRPGGEIDPSYDKRHLLWFGETVPLADVFPILRHVFARGTGLEAGTESATFTTGPIVLAVLNCYEDTLPIAGREAMSGRPNLLVNVTNDAWFSGSAEGELHLRLAVLRAIETRRDLVRSVNRGPTTWVDATGRIRGRAEAPPNAGPSPPLVLDAALLDTPLTLYTRAGDAPLSLFALSALLLPWVRRRLRTPAPG